MTVDTFKPRLHATLLDDWSALGALEGEWNTLLGKSRSAAIFLTWEWIQAWLDVTERRREPFVIVVRDADGSLRGIAPLYVARYRAAGVVPFRMLRVAADEATGAEYPDWIADRDCEQEVVREIVAQLRAQASRWHGMWLPNLSGLNGARHSLSREFRAQGCYSNARSVAFCSIELPQSLHEYEGRLSSGQRQHIRRKRRLILGRDDVSITSCESPEEVSAYLDALFDLHHRRWRLRGDPGSFERRPELPLFYRRFVPVALRNGWLRLYALRQGNAFRALQLGYVYDDVFYQIQEGFDPGFMPGAGNVLRHKVIETCIAEGIRVYDFMAGGSEHKRRWGAVARRGYDLFIGRPGVLTWPLFAAGVWPTGRYLRPVRAGRAVAQSDHSRSARDHRDWNDPCVNRTAGT